MARVRATLPYRYYHALETETKTGHNIFSPPVFSTLGSPTPPGRFSGPLSVRRPLMSLNSTLESNFLLHLIHLSLLISTTCQIECLSTYIASLDIDNQVSHFLEFFCHRPVSGCLALPLPHIPSSYCPSHMMITILELSYLLRECGQIKYTQNNCLNCETACISPFHSSRCRVKTLC